MHYTATPQDKQLIMHRLQSKKISIIRQTFYTTLNMMKDRNRPLKWNPKKVFLKHFLIFSPTFLLIAEMYRK